MELITEIWGVVAATILGFFESLGTSITSFTDILYTAENGFTTIGILAFIGLGISIAMMGLNFVMRLVRQRGK